MTQPPSLARLIEELERLPGIGRRSAERLAHHVLRMPEASALSLADAIREARSRIRACSRCRAPAESDPCPICRDPSRDPRLLVVVETARELAAFECGGTFRGLYYVLGSSLSPLDGVRPEDLDLAALAGRVEDGVVEEVCLATNPDLEGDGTALLIANALAGADVRVTRLARGLPSGGQIEYQSAAVLAEAFEGRRSVTTDPDGASDGSASDGSTFEGASESPRME